MFAAPRSDQQDIHVCPFSRSGVQRWHRSAAVSRGGARRQCSAAVGEPIVGGDQAHRRGRRSEEHTSELQSLMRISYAVFCLKTKKQNKNTNTKLEHTSHMKTHQNT